MDATTQTRLATRFVVGLTGGIGSGKSFVADRFAARHGITLVDADAIAHELTGPDGAAMPALAEAFGPSVIAADGRLDRAAMRELAFRDNGALARLQAVLHPMIRDESTRRILASDGPYVISVVAVSLKNGDARSRFDRVLVVDCPEDEQVERVVKRNGLAREQIHAIMAKQATREARRAAAHELIDNGAPGGSPLADIDAQVDALHARYVALAAAKTVPPAS